MLPARSSGWLGQDRPNCLRVSNQGDSCSRLSDTFSRLVCLLGPAGYQSVVAPVAEGLASRLGTRLPSLLKVLGSLICPVALSRIEVRNEGRISLRSYLKCITHWLRFSGGTRWLLVYCS